MQGRDYGEINDNTYKEFLETIERDLIVEGFSVHLPHRDTNLWGKVYLGPEEIVKKNWEKINSCDIIVAYPQKSRGVHVEVGWASALKKTVVILLDSSEDESELVKGLSSIATTILIRFDNHEELREKLRMVMRRIKGTF